MDKEAIIQWYTQEVSSQKEKAKKHTKYLFGGIKIFKWYLIIFAILLSVQFMLSIITYLSDPYFRSYSEGGLAPAYFMFTLGMMAILSFGSIAWLIYLLAWDKIHLISQMKEKNQLFRYGTDKLTNIRQTTTQLCNQMQIDPIRINFWGVISSSKFPSIEENTDTLEIDLILPVAFIVYFEENIDKGTAILAHELGHVMQDDTQLYLTTDVYFSIIRSLLLPSALLGVIIHIYIAYKLYSSPSSPDIATVVVAGAFIFDAFFINYLYNGFIKLREARRLSEMLADTAALIYADGIALINVLCKLQETDVKVTATHPNKDRRIQHLNELMQYVDE